jgi:hypothetical protein
MSEIVVRRPAALWQDRGRDYRIVVDGKDAGCVGNKGEARIAVTPGSHTVRMEIDWCRSPEVVVAVGAGTKRTLECGPNASPFLAFLYITVWKNKYLWLRDSCAHG